MPSTANKGFSVQSAGSNSGVWGAGAATALNEGVIEILDVNLGGITSLSLSSSNVALSTAQAQNAMIRMAGTLTANVAVSPDAGVLMAGFYYWENLTTGAFTVTLSNSAGSVTLPRLRRGVAWIDTTNGPRIVSIVGSGSADPIPTGTVMLFYQNAAPTGWTISSALNDYALKIVSSAGGVASGTVAYSTLFARTATDAHTLTLSQIPSHQHIYGPHPIRNNLSGSGSGAQAFENSGTADALTEAAGGGGSHTHDIDMRVQTASIILCTKD